jgi:hypothetical protein
VWAEMNFKFMHIFVEDSGMAVSFFVSRWSPKRRKSPGFPRKIGKPGAFCIMQAICIYFADIWRWQIG